MLVLLGAPWVGGVLQVVGGVGLLLLPVGWIMMVVGWARLARVDIRFGVAAGLMALLAVAALPFASPLTGAFVAAAVVRRQALVIGLMAWSTVPLSLAGVPGAVLGYVALLWMAVLQLAVADRCYLHPQSRLRPVAA